MARINNLTDFLTDVAAAIKTKKGSSTVIPAANFDTEILALPSQGVYQTKEVTITTNGNYEITPDENYDAMDKLRLNVAIESGEDLTDVLNTQDQKIAELEAALENKAAGGKAKLNIYVQTTEPTEKDGLWLQTNKNAEHYISDDSIFLTGDYVPDAQTPILPNEFYKGAAVAIGTDIYYFGSAANKKRLTYRFNTLTKSITYLGDVPTYFQDGTAVIVGSYVFLLGSSFYGYSVYKYDIANNNFSDCKDIPFYFQGNPAVAIGTDIYLFGTGYSSDVEVNRKKAYKYDTINDTYTQLANIPFKFSWGSTIATRNEVYLFGGVDNPRLVYKYNINTNTYTQLKNLPIDLYEASVVSIGNEIYIFGGTKSTQLAYRYNILTDEYTQITNIPYAFKQGSAVIVNDTVYLLGGYDYKTKVQIYHLKNKEYATDNSVIITQGRTYKSWYYTKILDTNFEEDYQPLYGIADAWFYTSQDGLITDIPTYYGDGTQWIKFKN